MNLDQIRASVDFVAFVEAELGPPLKRQGRWATWQCVFHNDSSSDGGSLKVDSNGRFWCFAEGKGGSIFDWIMARQGVSFREAAQMIQGSSFQFRPRSPLPAQTAPPAPWQRAVVELLWKSVDVLWSPTGRPALDYLRQRGLTDETIGNGLLGYCAHRREVDGLAGKGEAPVILPDGILIPAFDTGELWGVKIRRLGLATPRYLALAGSRACLYNTSSLTKPVAVVTEGELDTLLLQQEAGDLVGVVCSTAGCGVWKAEFTLRLAVVRTVLVSLDNDQPGTDAAIRLLTNCQRARLAPVPIGKDVGEFHLSGGSLRQWVASLL